MHTFHTFQTPCTPDLITVNEIFEYTDIRQMKNKTREIVADNLQDYFDFSEFLWPPSVS